MNTHNKQTVANISSSLKVPYMAWMEHGEWPTYMTFIDHMSDTTPEYISKTPDFSNSILSFGAASMSQIPQGPNGDNTNGSN
jgi:hypothetical protein